MLSDDERSGEMHGIGRTTSAEGLAGPSFMHSLNCAKILDINFNARSACRCTRSMDMMRFRSVFKDVEEKDGDHVLLLLSSLNLKPSYPMRVIQKDF